MGAAFHVLTLHRGALLLEGVAESDALAIVRASDFAVVEANPAAITALGLDAGEPVVAGGRDLLQLVMALAGLAHGRVGRRELAIVESLAELFQVLRELGGGEQGSHRRGVRGREVERRVDHGDLRELARAAEGPPVLGEPAEEAAPPGEPDA